jgi:hypothetical protein
MPVALSIYAAIVGTAALAWQLLAWHRSHRTLAEVSLSVGWNHQPVRRASVHVRVVNRSDHQITIEQVSIDSTSLAGTPSMVVLGGWTGREIPTRNGFSHADSLSEDQLDWSLPVKARVLLASGDWFDSTEASAP